MLTFIWITGLEVIACYLWFEIGKLKGFKEGVAMVNKSIDELLETLKLKFKAREDELAEAEAKATEV